MWNLLIKIFGTKIVLADTGGGTINLTNPLAINGTIIDVIGRVIGFLIAASIPVAALLIIWGGFQIMTAGGNPNKITAGKNIILYSIVGFIIVLCGWGIVNLLQQILGG